MLYTPQHKILVMKDSTQKTFDWPLCRISIVSATKKVGHQWLPNGIFGEYRAMETDAQLAAIPIARNPWPMRPTGPWPAAAGPIAQRKDEIAFADAVTTGRHSLRDEIIEAIGSLADGLHDPLTGFDDVSIADLVFRGDQTWGRIIQTDIDLAKHTVSQPLTTGIPLIEQFDKKMAIYRRLAASGYPTSEPDMFRNARALCAAQPELNGYLMDYLRTHILPASQTWQTLVTHVVQLASVMGYPTNRPPRAASALDANLDESLPTVAAGAVTLETMAAENKKLRQELEDLKKATPAKKKLRQSKYCFKCGYGSHFGAECNKMVDNSVVKTPFTPAMVSASKPVSLKDVNGTKVDGNATLWFGYKM